MQFCCLKKVLKYKVSILKRMFTGNYGVERLILIQYFKKNNKNF